MSEILSKKQDAKIKRCIKGLNDVMAELQTENPELNINWFLEDNDNLNLMKGDSHDDNHSANFDNSIKMYSLDRSSGGGW